MNCRYASRSARSWRFTGPSNVAIVWSLSSIRSSSAVEVGFSFPGATVEAFFDTFVARRYENVSVPSSGVTGSSDSSMRARSGSAMSVEESDGIVTDPELVSSLRPTPGSASIAAFAHGPAVRAFPAVPPGAPSTDSGSSI